MTCDRVDPYLTAYAAAELSEQTAAWVRVHVDGCERCAAVSASQSRLAAALRTLPADPVDPPAGFRAAVMARIDEREPAVRHRLVPLPPILPGELGRWPGEIARIVQDNREAIVGVASTAAVAAGAVLLAWRALRTVRPRAGHA